MKNTPDRDRHILIVRHFLEIVNTLGLVPKKYILQKRLALAKKQISHSELPLTEIAENCGYDDYYQFATYFKKEVGISPSQYRKNKKQPQTKK